MKKPHWLSLAERWKSIRKDPAWEDILEKFPAEKAALEKLIADEKNYPAVFHCIAGQDRTGCLAFMLQALLGVEENLLFLDWETTGFWNPQSKFSHRKLIDVLAAQLGSLPGKNWQEKSEHFVKSCGFTDADIAKFRSIMLEEKK